MEYNSDFDIRLATLAQMGGDTTGKTYNSVYDIDLEILRLTEQGGGGGGGAAIKPITYSELKSLRDNSQLVAGQQYRITDYVTTTAQNMTQSMGFQFDLIVTADSTNKINENARVINHNTELYIAMIVWNEDDGAFIYKRYSEGDDDNGYAWAYVIMDEVDGTTFDDIDITLVPWNNINTSDIIYTDTLTPTIGDTLDMGGTDVEVTDFSNTINSDYFANSKLEAWEIKYCLDNDTNRFSWADTTNGKGVIYYMKDEWNNRVYFDFKNIKVNDTENYLYLFDDSGVDSTIYGASHNNIIEGKYIDGALTIDVEQRFEIVTTNYQGQLVNYADSVYTLNNILEGI